MQDGPFQPRYVVTTKDGKPVDPEKRYLVIEVDPYPDARELAAIVGFTEMCWLTGYPELAASLEAELNPTDDPAYWYVDVENSGEVSTFGPMGIDHAVRIMQDINQYNGATATIRGRQD